MVWNTGRDKIFQDVAVEDALGCAIFGDESNFAAHALTNRSECQRTAIEHDRSGRTGNEPGDRARDRACSRADLTGDAGDASARSKQRKRTHVARDVKVLNL